MVPVFITIVMVLSLKRLKTSSLYDNKSARATFSASNHFLHLFFLDVPILRKTIKMMNSFNEIVCAFLYELVDRQHISFDQ